jgi:hypothetical protein
MKYALLFAAEEGRIGDLPAATEGVLREEFAAYREALEKAGILVAGERLRPTGDATTVRVRDKKAVVLAGPYVETQEQLGGFLIIDVSDLDRAIQWAAKCPLAPLGAIEIRPVWSD